MESPARYTAARNAPVTIASMPISADVGFSHESIGSPVALPIPTRPDAIPPSTAPNENGISTEALANSAPSTRASLIVAAWPRSTNAVPRKMIPIAAMKSGM